MKDTNQKAQSHKMMDSIVSNSLVPVTVLMVQQAKNNDYIVRLKADDILLSAMPGQFLFCNTSIDDKQKTESVSAYFFSVDKEGKYCELYFHQTKASQIKLNTTCRTLFVSEVKGKAFVLPDNDVKRVLKPILIGDDFGLPSIIFLAKKIKSNCQNQPLVFLSSSAKAPFIFPFTPSPSQFVLPDFPLGMLAACPLLEDKKIPSRLICDDDLPGCYDGKLEAFLEELPATIITDQKVEVFSFVEKKATNIISRFCEKNKLKLQLLFNDEEYYGL